MLRARVVSTQEMLTFVILFQILPIEIQHVIAFPLTLKKFDNCPDFNSDTWKNRASSKNCADGSKYHCCKDYDSPKSNCEQDEYYCETEIFVEGCAEEKFCKQGEEPVLNFIENQQMSDQPEVFCVLCYNSNRYNSFVNKSSATYSECPRKKENICIPSKHKFECGKTSSETSERFCRCDVMNGYSPLSHPDDHPPDGCSFTNFDCRNYALKCKPDQHVLLNYTCGPACKKGFYRQENSDECLPNPTTKRNEFSKKSSTPTPYTDESTTHTDMITERTTTLTIVSSKTLSPSIDDGERTYKIVIPIAFSVVILIVVITVFILWKKGYLKKRKGSEEPAEQTSQTVNQNQDSSSTASPQQDDSESEPNEETSFIHPPTPMYSSLNDEEKRDFVKEVLNACNVAMIEDLDPKPVIDWFKERNIFTKAKRRDIMEALDTSDRNRKLLERIQENGIDCYSQFKEALQKSKQYGCITILDKQERIVCNDLLNNRTTYAHSNSDISDDEATDKGE